MRTVSDQTLVPALAGLYGSWQERHGTLKRKDVACIIYTSFLLMTTQIFYSQNGSGQSIIFLWFGTLNKLGYITVPHNDYSAGTAGSFLLTFTKPDCFASASHCQQYSLQTIVLLAGSIGSVKSSKQTPLDLETNKPFKSASP